MRVHTWVLLLSRGASRDAPYLLGYILLSFPIAVTKYPDESNMGREGSFLLTVQAMVHHCREIKVAGT